MLRHHLALVSVAFLATQIATQKPSKPPPKSGDATATVAGEVGKRLDAAVLEVEAKDGGFCGVVLVAAQGKVLLDKGYGIADAAAKKPMPCDAMFDWASVSKQFTATAMLRLIEASRLKDADLGKLKPKTIGDNLKKWRKLGLDDPLARFWPEVAKDKAQVTVRQLLNHTSGIQAGFKKEWQFDAGDRDSFVKLALALPMTAKPGEAWEYSNSGYALIAALIERITGVTFEEYCALHVFKPAGMQDATMIGYGTLDPSQPKNCLDRVPKIDRGAGFSDRPATFHFAYGDELNWGYRGCGGIVATTRDMLAWDRALRDGKFLSKESLADLYKPALKDYALGWEVAKESGLRVQHSGGVLGVVTYYLRLLDDDVVVALACSFQPKDNPARLAQRLAQLAKNGS